VSYKLRAVIFDIDGVLLDSRAANIEYYRAVLARFGYPAKPESELAKGHYMNLREALAALTEEASEARLDALWHEAQALNDYPGHLAQVPEGAAEVIEALSQRYALAVVTSRHRFGVEHFYDMSGLRTLLSTAIAFEDYTHPKPHPEPLEVACRRLGVEPSEALYVGDAEVDVLCAAAAGLRFIAYGPLIREAALRALSFGELEALLETQAFA
jgi:pyrophosphatase PpaX